MKRLLIIILGLLMVNVVYALPLCSDTVAINTNCTLVTPALTCLTYDYWIYNSTGSEVEYDNLTVYTGDLYQLNITLSEGDYIVLLCDGSSKSVYVTEGGDDNMIVGILILIPLILMFVFLYWSNQLGDDHKALKLFFQLLIIPLSFILIQFSIYSVAKFYDWPDMINALADTSMYMGYVWYALGFYILIYLVYKALMHFKFKKEQDNEEIDYEV